MRRRLPPSCRAAVACLLLAAPATAQPVAVTKFFGSTTDQFDGFGNASVMHGDLMLVGARGETEPPPPGYAGGRVFAFRYTGSGPWAGWEEEARLYPTPEFQQDTQLGETVALLRGDYAAGLDPGEAFAIGGAPRESIGKPVPDNFAHGAAYVYRRDGATGAWALDGRLVPEGVERQDYTGTAVALAADPDGTVWAAAWSDRYYVVWRRDGAEAWVEETRFGAGGHAFGFGSTSLAGSAPGPAGPGALFAGAGGGAVRVWRRVGGGGGAWVEEAALEGSADGPGDRFGASVALDGDLLVVGSEHSPPGPDPPGGRAYVFRYTGAGPFGGWEEEAVLAPTVPRVQFGVFVTAAREAGGGDVAMVGASGAAHLFRRDPATGAWHEAPVLLHDELGLTGALGGVSASFAVIGNAGDDELGTNAGAGYLLDLKGFGVAVEPGPAAQDGLALSAHPNPARGAAVLALTLPEAGGVAVALYDGLGRRVALVHEGVLGAGPHRLALDVSGLPAGVYLARAQAAGGVVTAVVTVVR